MAALKYQHYYVPNIREPEMRGNDFNIRALQWYSPIQRKMGLINCRDSVWTAIYVVTLLPFYYDRFNGASRDFQSLESLLVVIVSFLFVLILLTSSFNNKDSGAFQNRNRDPVDPSVFSTRLIQPKVAGDWSLSQLSRGRCILDGSPVHHRDKWDQKQPQTLTLTPRFNTESTLC